MSKNNSNLNKSIGEKQRLPNKMLCFVIHELSTKFTIPTGYLFHRQLLNDTFYVLSMKVLKLFN